MQIRKLMPPVLTVAVLAVTAACQPADQQDDQQAAAVDTAAIMATFDDLRSEFEEAFSAGEAATMASQFTQDAIYAQPGAPPVTGRSEIRSSLEEEGPPEGATVSIQPTRTQVISADWAYEMGVSTVSFTPEGADQAQETSNTYLVVLHRTDDGWKLAAEALSPHQLQGAPDM